jgi:hypothetical protein
MKVNVCLGRFTTSSGIDMSYFQVHGARKVVELRCKSIDQVEKVCRTLSLLHAAAVSVAIVGDPRRDVDRARLAETSRPQALHHLPAIADSTPHLPLWLPGRRALLLPAA